MLPIAGQTAGPIGLKFIVDTRGWPVLKSKINSKIFFNIFLKTFFATDNAKPFSSYIYKLTCVKLLFHLF